VWKVFRDEGANEYATWMLEYWNGNPPGDYYPGDEYVDWLGLSCQNWWSGTTGRQGPYRSLGELVSPNYDYWTSVHKDKPIMIGEMSTEKHSVRWAAHRSGGLESLWRPDEGCHIQKRGNASLAGEGEIRRTLCGHEAGNCGYGQGEAPTARVLSKRQPEGRVSTARWNPKGLRRTAGP
jgi:hypothetical protein